MDVDGGHLLQIGEVAECAGLSLRTVRYYEEVGLVVPSARTRGGFRLDSDRDVARLLFVKRMKGLRLSLEQMRELADLLEERADVPADALAAWAQRLDGGIAKLERDLAQARELRDVVVRVAAAARPRPRRG